MKVFKRTILASALIFILANSTMAQNRPDHELHSMMIYNFLKYVQWPGELNTGDFVIGVIGDDEVYNTLNTWYDNKNRGDKQLTVKKFGSVADITTCQLLYVGDGAAGDFEAIQSKVRGTPTLTVTDKNGLGKKGSCINFKVVNNRLKFELNKSSVETNQLKVSSQLSSMAILI